MTSDSIQNPLISCQLPFTSVDFESNPDFLLKLISIPFYKALLTCLNVCMVHQAPSMARGVDHLLKIATATRSGSAKFSLKSEGLLILDPS